MKKENMKTAWKVLEIAYVAVSGALCVLELVDKYGKKKDKK